MQTSPLDGLHDIIVTSAATKITRDAPSYLIFRRVRIFFQQFYRSHHNSRSTETTVKGMILLESFLKWMQAIISKETFYRRNLFSIDLSG